MYRHFFKRLFDIVGALILLPFVLLLMLVIAPIIYFTDYGPVFYNANRMGRNGIPFKMYKFRSMYVNSPDLKNTDGSTFNSDDDVRVTPIGRVLRKTSLDEFPQFFNVLLGDMSFIGPRPTLTALPYEQYDACLKKRISVRPGVTGYSQTHFRNSISQQEKFKYDCYYVDNLSFVIDVKVILHTIYSVLCRKNINTNYTNSSK